METWNKTTEARPKDNGVYLTYGSVLGITTANYFGENNWSLIGITHWQFLPNPPKDAK